MKKFLNSVLITGALSLGIPEKSKAIDIMDSSRTKVVKTIEINNNENQLNIIIDQKLDEYNLTDNDKLQVKSLLKDEKFREKYLELLEKDDLLSIENIVLINVLIGILVSIILFRKIRKEKEYISNIEILEEEKEKMQKNIKGLEDKEKEYIKHIEILEEEKEKMQKNIKGLEDYVQTILNEGNGNIEKLKELFDLAPFPITKYRADGFPEVWNKKMSEETGFTHQDAINYYNELIEEIDGSGNKYFKKRGEVMSMLYKNTREHKDLDNTLEYLGMLKDAKKDGYSNIPFTLTTKWQERKTLLWTTRPLKEGGTLRFGIPKDQKIEELEDLLRKDVLTGAFNRRKLSEDFIKLCTKINREGDPKKYTIVILDLDNFKSINDIYSHDFGDEVLKKFTNHVKSSIRGNDILYRDGGDEFVLIMETDNTDEVAHKLNKIRKSFFDITFKAARLDKKDSGETDSINVGSSWGVQTINITDYYNEKGDENEIEESFKKLKKATDERMYRAKGFRFIKDKLISDGRIEEDWKEKNAIAEIIEDSEGNITGIKIIGDYREFTISLDELEEINKRKKELAESGKDLRS